MAAVLAAILLAACSPGPEPLEASDSSPEPTIEPPPSSEPAATPEESEAPSEAPAEAPIGEEEPLYAPLPELTPDPDNDVPDDLEQLILDAYADAYNTEFGMYAAGELDEEALRRTHFGDAMEAVRATVESLGIRDAVELSPDTRVLRSWITEEEGGVAVVRECYVTGPKTGQFARGTGELLHAAPQGTFAQDRLLELVRLSDEEEPRFRVTESAPAGTELCDA